MAVKGERTVRVPITSLDVVVQCDDNEGFQGTDDELEAQVREVTFEELENIHLVLEGDNWMATSSAVERS